MTVISPRAVRTEAIAAVVGHLSSGTSVSLVGMRASGRSTVQRHAIAALEADGWHVLRVDGVESLRDRPLAPLAVAGIDLLPGAPTASSIGAAVVAVEERLARSSVIAIDDADYLDSATAGVLMAARRRRQVPVLTVSRPAGRRQPHVRHVTDELGSGARLDVGPLRFDDVHAIVSDLLPGTVEPGTMARLAHESGGLPGLVTAIVRAGQQSGLLVESGGVWSAPGEVWTPQLSQAVEPLISDLDEDAVDALHALSLCGALPAPQATQFISWSALGKLDDAGLLELRRSRHGVILSVYPPLVVDHFRHARNSIRGVELEEQLRTTLPDEIRVVFPSRATPGGGWALSTPDAAHTVLSQQAQRHWALRLAEAREKWEEHPAASTAVEYVRALLNCAADPSAIPEVVRATPERSEDPTSARAILRTLAANMAIERQDLQAARVSLRLERRTIPEYDGLLRAVEAHLQLVLGSVPGQAQLADPAPAEDALSAAALAVVRSEVALLRGGMRDATDAIRDLNPNLQELAVAADIVDALSKVFSGEVTAAFHQASERLAAAQERLDIGAMTAFSYVVGLALTMAGRFEELDNHLALTLPVTGTPLTYRHYQIGNLVLAALAAARADNADYAESLALQAATLGRQSGPLPGMVPDLALDLVRGTQGQLSASQLADRLWRYAEDQIERGYVLHAVWVAVWAAERGPHPRIALRLKELVRDSQSEPMRLLVDYVVALVEADAARLATVGEELRRCEYHLYAYRAIVASVRLRRASGDIVGAAGAALETWRRMVGDGSTLQSVFAPLADDVALTLREREIAEGVASGLTNQAIADQRFLSVRTVENHLLNIFRKVGVDNRDDLGRAVTTWLAA